MGSKLLGREAGGPTNQGEPGVSSRGEKTKGLEAKKELGLLLICGG
jgi:hypothetical protein